MTDAEPERSDRTVELRVAPRLENLAVVRMLVTAIATFEDLDLDAVADLRLAVDEVCTRLIHCTSPEATLVVSVDPGRTDVRVRVSAECAMDEVVPPDSLSWHVLTALADEVATFCDDAPAGAPGHVCGVALTTRRVGSAR